MTVIELPDDEAAALKTRAAAQGLTLEAWFEKLSGVAVPTSQPGPRKSRYSLAELMAQCDAKSMPVLSVRGSEGTRFSNVPGGFRPYLKSVSFPFMNVNFPAS